MRWLVAVCFCTTLVAHPFFVERGVDALFFAGPTFSAVTLDPRLTAVQNGTTPSIQPSLQPGFTAGVRLLLDHDMWDGGLIYYWNNNTQTIVVKGDTDTPFNIANTLPFPSFTQGTETNAEINLSLKTLFLEVGRFVAASKDVGGLFRIHWGFAGNWEQQQLQLTVLQPTQHLTMDMTQDGWGAGFRTGFDGWYYVTPWLAFRGAVATSLLWTRFRTRRKDSLDGLQSISVESNLWKNALGFDMQAGCRLEKTFSQLLVAVDAGWFLQVFPDHMHFFLLENPQQQGDLSVNGIAVTLTASF